MGIGQKHVRTCEVDLERHFSFRLKLEANMPYSLRSLTARLCTRYMRLWWCTSTRLRRHLQIQQPGGIAAEDGAAFGVIAAGGSPMKPIGSTSPISAG
jgi:hypothetical protein